jgi:hypothetical protein
MLTQLTPDSEYLAQVLVPMVIISVGMAFGFIPVSSTALHAIGHHDAGVASAMINTSQQVGGSLGTALLNTVAVTTSAVTSPRTRRWVGPAPPWGSPRGTCGRSGRGLLNLFVAAIVAVLMLRVGKEAVLEEDAPLPVA